MPVVPCMAIADSITATNSSVEKVFKQMEVKKPHGEYQVYTAKKRAEIGKRAAVYGIASTKRKRKQEKDLDIAELPSKKKGCSLLLGELLDG